MSACLRRQLRLLLLSRPAELAWPGSRVDHDERHRAVPDARGGVARPVGERDARGLVLVVVAAEHALQEPELLRAVDLLEVEELLHRRHVDFRIVEVARTRPPVVAHERAHELREARKLTPQRRVRELDLQRMAIGVAGRRRVELAERRRSLGADNALRHRGPLPRARILGRLLGLRHAPRRRQAAARRPGAARRTEIPNSKTISVSRGARKVDVRVFAVGAGRPRRRRRRRPRRRRRRRPRSRRRRYFSLSCRPSSARRRSTSGCRAAAA